MYCRIKNYRNSNLMKIREENEKMGRRLQQSTPFLKTKKLDEEFNTIHQKLVNSIRKNTKGIPVYLPNVMPNTTYRKSKHISLSKSRPKKSNKQQNNEEKAQNSYQNEEPNQQAEANNEAEEAQNHQKDNLFPTAVEI